MDYGNAGMNIRISIHAPREGCDHGNANATWRDLLFQSTHPVRGATVNNSNGVFIYAFQSTHPVRGATFLGGVDAQHHAISIHAPREGCDGRAHGTTSFSMSFQSTHPVRGATAMKTL